MSIEQIADHVAYLKRKRFADLGAAVGAPAETGSNGLYQQFERGRVYWHPRTGAHALWGSVLDCYLQFGGPDIDANSGRRLFGFPSVHQQPGADGDSSIVRCETGSIVVTPGQLPVFVSGAADVRWHADGGVLSERGLPMQSTTVVANGVATWFERGVLWQRDGAIDVLAGDLPLPPLGNPAFVAPDTPAVFDWIRWSGGIGDLTPELSKRLWAGKLTLVPVGGPTTEAPTVTLVAGELAADVNGVRGQTLRARTKAGSPPVASGGALARSAELRLNPAMEGTSGVGAILTGTDAALVRRQLYSVAFQAPGLAPRVVAPHAIYARDDWSNFGIAHITDLHASRRVEFFRTQLRRTGVDEGDIAKLNNWNDRIRDFVRYANHLHTAGSLDLIMATGDLVDYVLEVDDAPESAGNFGFLMQLLTGAAPSLDGAGPPCEALRVPIFTSLGNHDYREHPYPLSWNLDLDTSDVLSGIPYLGGVLSGLRHGIDSAMESVPGVGLVWQAVDLPDLVINGLVSLQDAQHHHKGLNTTHEEAARIMGLKDGDEYKVPKLDPKSAARSVHPAASMRNRSHFYFRRINNQQSYAIALGNHRLVMLDTRWDSGIVDDIAEFALEFAGLGSEEQSHFVSGSPDSVGLTSREREQVEDTLRAASDDALVIVGMHAPPINPSDHGLFHALRETVHPTISPERTLTGLARMASKSMTNSATVPTPGSMFPHTVHYPASDHAQQLRNWTRTGTPWFHRGPIEDHLDAGTSVGEREALLRACAGAGGHRPATLLLCGHGHQRIDYRLRWDANANALEAYHDHYFDNPAMYYPDYVRDKWFDATTERRLLVRIKDGAPSDGQLQEITDHGGNIWRDRSELQVPPNPRTLDQATDRAAWWRAHAPVVVQTAALGPCTNTRRTVKVNTHVPGPNFQGFRLIQIANDVIQHVRYVPMDEVRTGQYPLAWELVPDAPPAAGGWGGLEVRDHRGTDRPGGTVRDHRQ